MFPRFVSIALILVGSAAWADAPRVANVKASKNGGTWTFDVTIFHNDTGWDNYADAWRVVDMNGTPLGVRDLAHPHETEQPFTRSLSNVRIPDDMTEVGIQTSDTIGGWYPDVTRVKLR